MKNFNQYPAPSGAYKVKINTGKSWRNYQNARLQMSLRNDKYVDQKLFSLLEWASHRFENIELIVSDSLVRHNLIFEQGINEDIAHELALEMGNDWLKKYRPLLDRFRINVSRWDDWLKHPNFDVSYKAILNQFRENPHLSTAVKNTIDRFWMRQGSYQDKSYAQYAPCGTNYMLEELAVFNCMFPEKAVDIYAGQWCSECVDAIRNSVVSEKILEPYLNCYYSEVDMSRNNGYKQNQSVA